MNLRFIHDNLTPLLAALIFIAATSCWFGTSVPEHTPSHTPPTEAWSPTQLAEHDSNQSIAAINARNLWGSALADTPKAPEWHVLGIAMSGAERFLLLAHEGKPVATLKIGDALPDGSKIVKIERDRFSVMTTDKKKLTLGISKHDQAK